MRNPTQEYRRTDHRQPKAPPAGLDALVNWTAGAYSRRHAIGRDLFSSALAIHQGEAEWRDLSDHHLRTRLFEFAERFRRGGRAAAGFLPTALAAIREAADRRVGLRPFPVQLMGALALHRGFLAEMATGEGKTLTAGLASVLAGWTGRPAHVITANDYLVERDANWLRPLYEFCGLQVGFVTAAMQSPDRKRGYTADITYATSKEIVADFLRDRLRLGPLQDSQRRLLHTLLHPGALDHTDLVMRGLHSAIIDEADSLLIDEAVTPLIISAPHKNDLLREACERARELVVDLEPGTHYEIVTRHREIELTEAGKARLAEHAGLLPPVFRGAERREELVRQALVAREFFIPGKQYVILDGKIVIVDEFTGRIMHQRTWRAGLHQAIEAKEHLPITDPTETLARLSFQRFFRLYHRLSGMTGTAREAAAELWQVYRLAVVSIPTHRPCLRTIEPDQFFATAEAKWEAVAEAITRLHASGRPILAGTRSITASETLSDRLRQRGLHCRVLNALRLSEEAGIVSDAGAPGQITIATNMAGRGTDIRLGKGVAEAGGLHVIATERHESGRIDRQLFGRCARQGDPGSAQAFVSLEDELLTRQLPEFWRHRVQAALRSRAPGAGTLTALSVKEAQRRSQRAAARQRAAVLRADTWLDEALAFSTASDPG